jgi:hypothetical protein
MPLYVVSYTVIIISGKSESRTKIISADTKEFAVSETQRIVKEQYVVRYPNSRIDIIIEDPEELTWLPPSTEETA